MAAFDSDVDMTVEFGFGSGPMLGQALITWTDLATRVKAGQWSRGRGSVQSDFPAGFGTLLLDNTDGELSPWNTAGSFSPNVKVGTPVRITATHNLTSYVQFYGFVQDWSVPFPTNRDELVVVSIVERFGRLQDKAASHTFVNPVRTDEFVNILSQQAGWPVASGEGNFGSGVEQVPAGTYDGVFLDMARLAVEVEQGQMFQSRTRALTFVNRIGGTFTDPDASFAPQATFGPDGAELTYIDVDVVFNDDRLLNEAVITPGTGDEQTASNSTSVDDHGTVTYRTTNELMRNGAVALNVAEWVVGKGKDVKPRVRSLTIDPAGDPSNLWPEVLDRDLRDIITVEATYPGTSVQFTQDVAIETVSHSFEVGGVWAVTYGCHPLSALEQTEFWELGTSDDLGTDTILA